jgi:hypothetical protein
MSEKLEHPILSNEEYEAIVASCRRNKIKGRKLEQVIEWAGQIQMQAGLLSNVVKGFMDIAGFENGEAHFSLSPAGIDRVEVDLLKLRSHSDEPILKEANP